MYRSPAKEYGSSSRSNHGATGRTQAWYVTPAGAKHLKQLHEDLTSMPTDLYRPLCIYDDPSDNYKIIQTQLHTFPLLDEEGRNLESIAVSIEVGVAREAAMAIRKLQEILQFKTQIGYGKALGDAYTQSILPKLRAQNLEARELRGRIEQLSNQAGYLRV
ncbi:hypothetical protein L6452_28525 [Arctium lappa]|uniref:Uncharacterized protein n=1 Tax=Arctium lappa TaxID=4217 RepID=A0ACB8ZYY8_ARCLA|nr:hypothetical protein L6452_28525 [Arctium lappa]